MIFFFFFLFFSFFADDDLEGYDKTVSGRRKAGRVSHASVTSHLCFPCTSSVFHPRPLLYRFAALVEQEEREGRDIPAQSVHRWEPEAGSVSGGTGRKTFVVSKCTAFFFFHWLMCKIETPR